MFGNAAIIFANNLSREREGKNMKRFKCLMVMLMVFSVSLGFSGFESNAISKKVEKQYTKILKKYIAKDPDDFEAAKFAIVDIDKNGTPELIIQKEGRIPGKVLYYSCKNGKAIKLKAPKRDDDFPCYGTLDYLSSRKSFAFYRGGPAYDDENGNSIMPHTIMEYKVKGKKIVCVSSVWKNEYLNKKGAKYGGKIAGKKVTHKAYNTLYRALGKTIEFETVTYTSSQRLRQQK